MKPLLEILQSLHPEVDFAQREDLIAGRILDSFDIVTLVAEIEDAYGVVIPPEKLLPEHFGSAGAIYALICQLHES